jgi:hypothetical protein
MSIRNIHLRKLLKIMFLDPSPRRSALRSDIRDDIAREAGESGSGGDFYAPFWFDAKMHVFGTGDLHQLVEDRIAANSNRANLYPLLRDGFLLWYNERRRWTNEPFHPGSAVKAQYQFSELDSVVKVEGILSVRDGASVEHYVYPYFSPSPPLSNDAARLGLWMLCEALPRVPSDEIRILDVIRGQTFSLDRVSLTGGEQEEFLTRYGRLIGEWESLRTEYD